MYGIEISNLNKSFKKEIVLQNINLTVPYGRIVGIVGNNGCGKTVLMKCVCGFLKPDSGKILVNGKCVGKDCDFPDSLGMIIETPGFIPNMSGYRNLKILASLKGKISNREILAAIDKVGLMANKHKSVTKYSLGMRQRLGIAQAIMENPDVLILDEPFNGLDKTAVEEMRILLKDLRSQKKAILLASHNAADINALCDEVYEMEVHKK